MSYRTGRIACLLVFVAVFRLFSQPAQAQGIRVVEEGPIHEAFVPPVTGVVALEAIDREPPPPITERIPPKCGEDVVWIKGYWAYDEDIDDFYWVNGTWRKEPPKRKWIDGYWKRFDEGWVWIRGLWSEVRAAELAYIDDPPPEPFDEDPPSASGRNYFWLAGHWAWTPQRGYVKYTGRWMEMDPKWVLVPASYAWREEGYVFIPAYWDWPIENRGCTYKPIYVEPAARTVEVVYEPAVIVEPVYVVGWCYSYYPDYVYLVHHHYHHHHDWWHVHFDVPTWWGWHGWWAFSWHDHWGLWWWYSHPGYPHPHFINASYAAMIHPPSEKTVIKIKNVVKAPKIVTKTGVISGHETLKLAKGSKGKEGGKKGKSAPVIAATTKSKDKDDKGDKKDKEEGKLASSGLRPGGTKTAKKDKDDDDPKKHPPKPKAGKSGTLTSSPATTKPAITRSGEAKGTDKDDGKDKSKGKTGTPPITDKGKGKGKDDDKDTSRGRAVGSDTKSKGSDRPKGKDKSDDTSDDKPKRPPLTVPGGDKSKDKDKDKSKPKGDMTPKKSSGSSTVPSDSKPKDKPPKGDGKPDVGKPKDKEKPPKTSDDKPSKGKPAPPTNGAKKDKEKDKDKEKEGKKKDRS